MSPQTQAETFLLNHKTLILSTTDETGTLETSVTPFILHNERFYIFISELAQHTQNMLWQCQASQMQLISALLVADESQTEQLFARERMNLQLTVSEIQADASLHATVLELFSDTFGEVISLLRSLPDFHLFELIPVKGGYVRGFGQAFAFEKLPSYGLTPVRN